MAKTLTKKKPGKTKFTGYMLPISLTKQIRAMSAKRNKSEKKAGERLTTQSDIVTEALAAYL